MRIRLNADKDVFEIEFPGMADCYPSEIDPERGITLQPAPEHLVEIAIDVDGYVRRVSIGGLATIVRQITPAKVRVK